MSKAIPQWVKDAKYHFCAACGRTDDLQYNHLDPKGPTVPENIIVLCAPCHQKYHRQGGKIHHNYLVKEGIAAARERGVELGRPDKVNYDEFARVLAENSTRFHEIDEPGYKPLTEHEIMDKFGIKSSSTMKKGYDYLLNAMKAEVWPYSWPKPTQVRDHPMYEGKLKRLRGTV